MTAKRTLPPQHHHTVLPVHRNRTPKKQRLALDTDPSLLPPPPLPPLLTAPRVHYLRFSGSAHFRDRLVCAALSGRALRIADIRALDDEPGLRDYEVSFLRLLELISTGAKVTINETGTAVSYQPGTLSGGRVLGLTHACPPSRGIGYFLLPLLSLSPFVATPLRITLTGCTNHPLDPSVDLFTAVTLPLSAHFLQDMPTLTVKRRGFTPLGGGEVAFYAPTVKTLRPINLTSPGLVKRFRGTAVTSRCSPQQSSLMISSARAILNRLLPDVHVYADHAKGKGAGPSPGFSLTLVAESTTGVLRGRDCTAEEGKAADAVGGECAAGLVEDAGRGGCVDGVHEAFMFLWMALTPEVVSRVRVGRLSSWGVDVLRLVDAFFSVRMDLQADEASDTVLVTAMGSGYQNLNRRAA